MDPVLMVLGVVNWLINGMLNSISSNFLEAWASRQGLGDDVEELKGVLRRVTAELCNAEGMGTNNPFFGEMLQELRGVVEDADNLLDEMVYFRLKDEVKGTNKAATTESSCCGALHATGDTLKLIKHKIFHRASKSTDIVLENLEFERVLMGPRLRKAIDEMQRRCNDVHDILLTLPERPPSARAIPQRTPTTAFPSHSDRVFGRDELRNAVVRLFTGNEHLSKHLNVLPIVGHGGLGKTTFARYVFHDGRLSNIFRVKMWVCVSLGQFDIIKLTCDILNQITSEEGGPVSANSSSLMYLQDQIVKKLDSKKSRFLLVLDDLWECSQSQWDSFIAPFSQIQTRGNAIMVTTRMPAIAKMVKRRNLDVIQFEELDTDSFWKYFTYCIFGEEDCDFEDGRMKNFAHEIVPKLKGNPLAAKTIGRLLASDLNNLEHWREVTEKPQWKQGVEKDDIMPVLRLSYEYLEFPINRCFLYCALFPDDYQFDEYELVRFWISQEFVECSGEGESIEDMGVKYLNTLVNCGFLQKECQLDGSTTYSLHDLIHQLARSVSSAECYIVDSLKTHYVPLTIRHVSILTKSVYKRNDYDIMQRNKAFERRLLELKQRLNVGKLCTLMLIGDCDLEFIQIFGSVFEEASGLWVLHISMKRCIIGNSLSRLFSKLLHLRYFCLQTADVELPNSLSSYYNLRVLKTDVVHQRLRDNICDLRNLRHFVAPEYVHSWISNVGKLLQLQELRMFKVGLDEAFKVGQLCNMRELHGALKILGLQNIQSIKEAQKAMLEEKQIKSLSLSWDQGSSDNKHIQLEVIESLRPNKNVKRICIDSYGGEGIPRWLLEKGHYVCLESICFWHCMAWRSVPAVEVVHSLKELELWGLDLVKKLEFCGRDSRPLEKLVVTYMEQLTMIEMNEKFEKLKSVRIIGCPELLSIPFFNRSLKDRKFIWLYQLECVEIESCDKLDTTVPPLPHVSTLQFWSIRNVGPLPYHLSKCDMKELSFQGKEELGVIGAEIYCFQDLSMIQRMEIRFCYDIEKWYGLHLLTSLDNLLLADCSSSYCTSKFSGLKSLLLPPSIKNLELWGCNFNGEMVSNLLVQLPALSGLSLRQCPHIHYLLNKDVVLSKRNNTFQNTSRLKSSSDEDMNVEGFSNTSNRHSYSRSFSLPRDKSNALLPIFPDIRADILTSPHALHIPSHFSASLRSLQLWDCPEMMMLDGDDILLRIFSLVIIDCPKLFLGCPLAVLPSTVERLKLRSFTSQVDLPVKFLSRAFGLRFVNFQNCRFTTASLEGLYSLRHLLHLDFWRCEGFVESWKHSAALAEGAMFPAEALDVDDAGVLVPAICRQLSSLRTLKIKGNLEMLTEEQEGALSLLPSLKVLTFYNCGNLSSLPRQLPALEKLSIRDCPKIKSLPPAGLPSTLQVLDVWSCSRELGDHCERLKGIPKLSLSGPWKH